MTIRKGFLFQLTFCSMLFSSIIFASAVIKSPSVAENWVTFDDHAKQPSSVIHIFQSGQYYVGKVVKIYGLAKGQPSERCVTCHGNDKNKPILGLEIIRNMICQQGSCHGGTITDPRDGKVYHATMHIANGGQLLKVRGYVGLPILGKTVIWKRLMS